MKFKSDPDGTRLPVKLETVSNGEYMPERLPAYLKYAARTAHDWATANARALGTSRRGFLVSLSGAATCLLAMNRASAAVGMRGGHFEVPADAALDGELAEAALGNREFIFDIQTHHFDPPHRWAAATPWSDAMKRSNANDDCALPNQDFGYMACTDGAVFVREIFMDSDTDAAVLSFVPTAEDKMPLGYQEASATRQIVNAMSDGSRLFLHGRIIPNLPGDLERMESVLETWDIAAWKTYTQYGPDDASGWWFDDEETGQPFIERVRASGVKTICVHKGLPLPFPLMGRKNLEYRSCRDIGPAAKANPDIKFIVYHSGFDPGMREGPFRRGRPASGADSLVQSLLDAGVGPNSNVYAELGSTWWQVMRDPDQAAHLLGKLFRYVGEDNVLWGTDCIFYGSPQDQIQAFRSFQISEEFRERYGYPEITPELRAKVFGLNSVKAYGLDLEDMTRFGSRDAIGRARANYAERRDPSFRTYGPKTRREVFLLADVEGH